tara:strand:- start:693 stop:3671 length:2979 start_codon:yes stop_codon:yes gene_type:complete
MRKKILITGVSILLILIVSIAYLSIYGVKTDKFNKFINNKVKDYNSKLTLQTENVHIKLNLSEIAIKINTKNSKLITEFNAIKISNIDINLDLIKFLKNESSIKNFNIKSSSNSIVDITSFLNTMDYNLSRYIFYSQIKEGLLNFEIGAKLDSKSQEDLSYFISGSVSKAKLNIPGNESLNDINFNFQTQDKITKISNLNFIYQEILLSSKRLDIKQEKSGEYYIEGDIENTKALINPNLVFKYANIKQDYLSDKDILFKSKNLFSFKFSKNKKIKNIKIDSVLNFDEVYFNNRYQNLIFLKEGIINSKLENGKFTAEVDSNFAFLDDLNLNNEFKNNNLNLSLIRKNSQKIEIKGSINNGKTIADPNIFLNLFDLDLKLLSDKKINIETDNNFKFEINNNKIENYLVNSEINLEKLELNKEIQDVLYLKNIKTNIILGDKLFNIDFKSNYSFIDKNFDNESENNIINFKLDKNDSKISDVEIFVRSDNNSINTKEFKKYLKIQKQDNLIDDQIVNINSNFKINASIDDTFSVKKFSIKSDLNFDNLNINYRSNLIKKYLTSFDNKIAIKNPQILFEYSNDIINLHLDGKYLLKNKEDNFFIKYKGSKNNFELYSLLDLNESGLKINEVQYLKKKNIPSKLEILLNKSIDSFNLEKISYTENKNYISVNNLHISDDFKIQSVDKIDVNFQNSKGIKNNFKIKKNSNNYQLIGNQIDGEKIIEKILNSNNENKFFNLFKNLNTSIILSLDNVYLEKNEYLKKFVGEFDIKNNKLFLAKLDGVLDNENKFSYNYRTTAKNEKITNIAIQEPKPFINNYNFIKGFDEGELILSSTKIDNTSRTNLKITNFKIKEVPILAKILTLASLQGIADLLTGEGIRFDKFEMDFKSKNNLIEIDEIYALGPAISIMMEGYIEKNRLTSLRGTLVPATTINKTISKIPLLGNILVGNKTGEGVFGVSFKIKGQPNNLKSTVNPIKTLTPRFITRTLENIKGN